MKLNQIRPVKRVIAPAPAAYNTDVEFLDLLNYAYGQPDGFEWRVVQTTRIKESTGLPLGGAAGTAYQVILQNLTKEIPEYEVWVKYGQNLYVETGDSGSILGLTVGSVSFNSKTIGETEYVSPPPTP